MAGAAQADAFLVSARAGGSLALYWVPRDTAGAALTLEPLADGRASGTLTLTDALAPRAHLVAEGGCGGRERSGARSITRAPSRPRSCAA